MMKFFNSTIGIVSLTGALLAVSILVHGTLLIPEYKKSGALRGALHMRRAEVPNPRLLASEIETLLSQYEYSPQLQETVSIAMPVGEDTASIFHQIKTLAAFYRLSLESFSADVVSSEDSLGVLEINLELNGEYDSFWAFMNALERNARIINIVQAGFDEEALRLVLESYYTVPL